MVDLPRGIPWYHRPWVVLVLLFLVLGPFGLPLVYKSPKFNRAAKIFLTLAMAVYTYYLIYASVEAVRFSVRAYEQYRGILW